MSNMNELKMKKIMKALNKDSAYKNERVELLFNKKDRDDFNEAMDQSKDDGSFIADMGFVINARPDIPQGHLIACVNKESPDDSNETMGKTRVTYKIDELIK